MRHCALGNCWRSAGLVEGGTPARGNPVLLIRQGQEEVKHSHRCMCGTASNLQPPPSQSCFTFIHLCRLDGGQLAGHQFTACCCLYIVWHNLTAYCAHVCTLLGGWRTCREPTNPGTGRTCTEERLQAWGLNHAPSFWVTWAGDVLKSYWLLGINIDNYTYLGDGRVTVPVITELSRCIWRFKTQKEGEHGLSMFLGERECRADNCLYQYIQS